MATSTKQKIDSCLQWDNLLYTIESPEREWEVWSDIWPSELWVGMKGSGRSEIVNVIWQHNWQRGHKKQHQQNNTSLHFRLPNIVIDLIILCIQIFIFFSWGHKLDSPFISSYFSLGIQQFHFI